MNDVEKGMGIPEMSEQQKQQLSTKGKILIGVLMGVILISGFWIWNRYQPSKPSPFIPSIQDLKICENDFDCMCRDSLGIGESHSYTTGRHDVEYINVCVNKKYKNYDKARFSPNPEEKYSFCAIHNCKCENSKCISVLKPPFIEEVVVATDKKEYEQEDIIEGAIKNNLPEGKPIWYNVIPVRPIRQHLPLVVLKYNENDKEWREIYENQSIKNPKDKWQLSGPWVIKFEFEKQHHKEVFKNSGRYKIGFVYTLDKSLPNINWITSYSDEFVIQKE